MGPKLRYPTVLALLFLQSDSNSPMHALHLLVNAAISNRASVRLGQQPCMLTFDEFDTICDTSSQVLQSLLVFQDVLRERFFGKRFWDAVRPEWAKASATHPYLSAKCCIDFSYM